ncbi:MAG: outer membrane protein assembly factor BamA [Planctomycetota bacterium]|jgi:outer membrane protein insertion porin family
MQQGLKGLFVILLAAGCFVTGPVFAADEAEGLVIESLQVAGTVTLTRAQVISAVQARSGRTFSAQTAAQDVQQISQLEAVESAYYNTQVTNGRVTLTYVVVERNLVRSITFYGNKKLKDNVLLKTLSYKRGDYLDMFAVRAGIDALKEKYLKKGYPWVTISVDEAGMMLGKVIYTIEEGPRTKIQKVEFVGNEAFSNRELKKGIKTKPKKYVFFNIYYSPEQVEADNQKLLEIFQKRSYLDAQVSHAVSFNDDKSKATVTFTIVEGPEYMVDSIHFSGNTYFDDDALGEELKLRDDYLFSESWAEYDSKKIRGKYGEQGFVETQIVTQKTILPDARVKIDFDITEGDRYRIGEVLITGNETIKDHAIRRVLDEEGFTPGEWYNAEIAQGTGEGELERILRQTVVTESAKIFPVGDDEDTRDALVTIKEGQTGSIMLGAGVSSDSGLLGNISLDQRNFDISDTPSSFGDLFTGKAFRGAGQRFKISLSPGTELSTYLISFTEPYLYDLPVSLNVAGSSFERDRESWDENRLSAKIGLEKRYPSKWRRGFSFRAENVEPDSFEVGAPPEVIAEQGDNYLFGSRFYIRKDTTDSRYRPSRGYNFDCGYEQVLGDHTFGLLTATQRWYKTLYEDLSENKTVLETKLFGGTVVGNAPTFERFYVGGNGSMRGFEYRGISNRSGAQNDPIGSDWAVVGNSEISIPLGSETFAALFFADAGTIDDGEIRASIGTGIQIMIPQFFGPVPMRFELAAPLMKENEDETQPFSFSVGALF